MEAKLGAAVYVRVSTPGQEEKGSSLGTQEQGCRRFAREHGLAVDEGQVYREVFTGAELWDRPQLTQLRAAIRQRAIGAVVCYAVDRLSRDPVHLGVILSEAEHAGVPIHFVTEVLDDSPEGQLIRFVRGYAASVERAKIIDRSIRGKRARVDSGKLPNFGGELYGYRRDKKRGIRTVHEDEAAIVRQIYAWIAEGASIRSVFTRLNQQGVPSPGSERKFKVDRKTYWGKGVVRRILKEPAYKGESIAWRLRRVEDKSNGKKVKACVVRPESEWVYLPDGTTPALVTPGLWADVQAKLAANVGDATRNECRPYLLRGLIYCGCGRKMRSAPEHGGRVYRCSSRETPDGPCGRPRVPADAVEAWTWGQVARIMKTPTMIEEEVKRRRKAGPDPLLSSGLEAARRSLAKVEKDQERLVHTFRVDEASVPVDLLRREMAAAEHEKKQLQSVISDLERRLAQQDMATRQLEALNDFCAREQAQIDSLDFAGKRQRLEALDVEVIANGPFSLKSNWRVAMTLDFDTETACDENQPLSGCVRFAPISLVLSDLPDPDPGIIAAG